MLGAHVPEWAELAEELASVTSELGASNAIVADAWGHVWCRAVAIEHARDGAVHGWIEDALDAPARPLERGGRIDHAGLDGRRAWYARSYAGVYLVLAWWLDEAPPTDDALRAREQLARACVERRLLRLQTLTLKLPPPDGPDVTSGAAAKRMA